MKQKLAKLTACLMTMTLLAGTLWGSAPPQAAASGTEFPIGIFYPPSPAETTLAKYQQIKDMNANLIVGAAVINTPEANDAALALADSLGLKMLVDDYRFHWRTEMVQQPAYDTGYYVSNTNRLGQTFRTPAGSGWYLSYAQLKIDPVFWGSGTTLTMRIYDSPARATLLGSASVGGPQTVYDHGFGFGIPIAANTTYYMELTSNSASPVGWVTANSGNPYGNGMFYDNGTAVSGTDLLFYISFSQQAYNDRNSPNNADVDLVANYYKTKSGLLGYHLYDEPGATLFNRVAAVRERIRAIDPGRMAFVNLFPNQATDALLKVNAISGEFSRPTSVLGQSFTTSAGQTAIDTIQLWVDRLQWGSGEALTLRLWNSPSKTSLVAQSTLTGATNNWPVFTLNATVSPNASYYWELTHNGGGDGSIGWVIRTEDGLKLVKDGTGTGYVNGTPIDSDFWFVVNQNIQGGTYEDYVYRWTLQQPDVMAFDHYPFKADGTLTANYYDNLETIRRQSLLADLDFWSYIQSVGITGHLRKPSQNDMRYQIYTNLAYGAKGYIYFTYRTPGIESSGEPFHNGLILPDGTTNDTYGYATTLNAEVLKLGPTLLGLQSQAVYHTGTLPATTSAVPSGFFWQPSTALPSVIGYFTNGSGRKYVMVVNRDEANSRTLSFTLPGKPASVTEVSKSTGLEVGTSYNAATGVISASFAPGEGKLYALPAGF